MRVGAWRGKSVAKHKVSKASISWIICKEKRKEASLLSHPPKKRERKTPFTLEILTFVLSLLKVESQLSVKQLVEYVKAEYPIHISISTLAKALKKLDVTWKNVLPILTFWNTPEVIEKRQQFVVQLAQYKLQNKPIFYTDETGFTLYTKTSKGRTVAGEKARLTLVPKGKWITIIVCISLNSFVYTRQVQTGTSTLSSTEEPRTKETITDQFSIFFLDLCAKLSCYSILIIDNYKIHHTEKLQAMYDILWVTYGIRVQFLSPYSPFLNLIELTFNKLKTLVQQDTFHNQPELV